MIPKTELNQLIQHYKGELTENAQLNKAATLAAKKHLLLDSKLPPPIVNAEVKPLSRELSKLTKWIRQFPGGVGVGGSEEEDESLVTGPVDQWVKKMIKGSPATPKAIMPSDKVKESKPKAKRFLPVHPDSKPKSAQKAKPVKKRKTEVEKLKPLPGWTDWAQGKKLRRRLDYDSD